jgi:hypothetical protein
MGFLLHTNTESNHTQTRSAFKKTDEKNIINNNISSDFEL